MLSRKEEISLKEFNLQEVFEELLRKYPSAFVYAWFHPAVGLWLGATPETLLKTKETKFLTMALAGTKLYRGDIEVNWGEKEKKERSKKK